MGASCKKVWTGMNFRTGFSEYDREMSFTISRDLKKIYT